MVVAYIRANLDTIIILNINLFVLYGEKMFVYLSEQNMPYLPLIISIKLIGFLIILAIAKNNKKKIRTNNKEA